MVNPNNISKKAILDFINECIDVRIESKDYINLDTESGRRYDTKNDASIDVFKRIKILIEEGKFDVDVDLIAEVPENPNNFDETFSHLLNK